MDNQNEKAPVAVEAPAQPAQDYQAMLQAAAARAVPEQQQENPDQELYPADPGTQGQHPSGSGGQSDKGRRCRGDSAEGGAPPDRQADGEDDRIGFDPLDCCRQEG